MTVQSSETAFEKGKSYKVVQIKEWIDNLFHKTGEMACLNFYGPHFTCGQYFASTGTAWVTYSFVLTGTQKGEAIYECIYAG